MASSITFQQLEEQWPLPKLASLADLIEDRERSESLRNLLDAQCEKLADLYDCARVLFDHGFLSFDFTWGQNDADVEIALSLPKDVDRSLIVVKQGSESVSVSLKPFGRRPILDAKLWESIDVDESHWVLERMASASILKIVMHKPHAIWWTQLFQDDGNRPALPCQDALSADQAYTYAQTMEMTLSDQPSKIFSMYKLAADLGHPIAASRVGNTFVDGDQAAGVVKDQSTALHYLMIGAEHGHHECMFQVGHAFHHGIVYERDFDKAVFWYTQAAEAGHHVLAAYFLGLIYHRFDERAPEPDKAVYWWERAAQQGHPDSTFNLGLYYYSGASGVDVDRAKALDLFTKATAANASYIELLHENGIDLEALQAEVAAAETPPASRSVRSRRKRSKRRGSWRASLIGASIMGAVVVAGLAWYNRVAIRQWAQHRVSPPASDDRKLV